MSRSVRMPMPLVSGSRTMAAPTRRADISRAAWRRVWAGPMVRTIVLMASRTSMDGATSLVDSAPGTADAARSGKNSQVHKWGDS